LPRGFSFAKRVRGQTTLFHCVRLFFAPRVFFCQAGARPLVACSPPLAALRTICRGGPAPLGPPGRRSRPPHPPLAGSKSRLTRLDRDPAARPAPGPLGVSGFAGSPTPRPGPHAGSPRSRETWPLAPAGRFETPTLRLETLKPGPGGSVAGPLERFIRERGVVGRSAPRAIGAMAPKRVGTERPDRRVETLAPTERLLRGRGTARIRTPGCACSVAREGGSAGCARGAA